MNHLRNISAYVLLMIFGVLLAHDLDHNHLHASHIYACCSMTNTDDAHDGCDHREHAGDQSEQCSMNSCNHQRDSHQCNIYPNYIPKQDNTKVAPAPLVFVLTSILSLDADIEKISDEVYIPDCLTATDLWRGLCRQLRGPPIC